jgi:putative membrane protein
MFFRKTVLIAVLILFFLFFGLGLLLAKLHWVQRVFVPNQDEIEQVEDRAEREFFLNRVHLTEGKTGILIFVSVMERRAVILADAAINEKVGPEEWDSILHDLTARLKEGSWDLAFKEAIARCGAVLAKHFPAEKQNPNEITNHLIIKN